MSIEDTIGYQRDETLCIVCGQRLKPGEALVVRHEKGRRLPLCCPLCLETYQKNPAFYLERWAKRTVVGELRHSPHAPAAEGGRTIPSENNTNDTP